MDLKKELEKINKSFDLLYKNIEDDVLFDNKTLENSLKIQIELQLNWETLNSKTYYVLEESKLEVDIAYSEAYTSSMSDSYKSVSATDAKHLAICDSNYISEKRFNNKVLKVKKNIEACVSVIESRKYLLKDITAATINGCDGHIL